MSKRSLYSAVFFSGLVTLAAELAASRLLENHFGTSNLIYASIIGLILIYLTAGYFIGGWWADRSPNPRTFLQILAWGGFFIGLIPLASRPVLRLAAEAFDQLAMGALIGSFVVVMVLFILPITLLGMASPFAIRLAITDPAQAGRVSGRIYAISTLGSFIGTFLPGMLLIPLVGTYRTFLVISGLLVLVALYLLAKNCGLRAAAVYTWMPAALMLLAVLGTRGFDKATPGLIYESESAYNYIQVVEEGPYRFLRLNEGQGVHSIYHPTELVYAGPWEQVLAAPYFNPAPVKPSDLKSMAIVGLAAGTTARQATAAYGPILIDGFEIDPKIVEVGREYFDMNQPNLHVYVQDGRYGLAQSDNRYQVISLDAYRPPYIPWHLTTVEFFQTVRDHLTEDGVVTINVGRAPNDRRLIEALTSTMLTVFPSVHVMDIPDTFNSIVYATAQQTDISNLDANLMLLRADPGTHPLILRSVEIAMANLQPAPAAGPVFTDDKAAIEWLTNNLVLSYLFAGDLELLQ
ncbi:MAG: fused MFS/spermidine synthase [Anaerolineaceae bacterium]|nr:fused MFS/spermidine synthase [Anaerolineaceae bacterium]